MPLRFDTFLSGGGGAGLVTPQPDFTDVVFLAPFDGSDGQTPSPELSNSAHALTYNNQAAIHTGLKKFGTASLLLDGVSDTVTAVDHADWAFGAGEFAVEAWVRLFETVNDTNVIVSQWGGTDDRSFNFSVDNNTNVLTFQYSTTGADTVTLNGSFTFLDEIWYHVAVDRDASNDIRLYVDGAVVGGPTAAAVTFNDSAEVLRVAAVVTDDINEFKGRIDDLRIVKGWSYGGPFLPPSTAHPTS